MKIGILGNIIESHYFAIYPVKDSYNVYYELLLEIFQYYILLVNWYIYVYKHLLVTTNYIFC